MGFWWNNITYRLITPVINICRKHSKCDTVLMPSFNNSLICILSKKYMLIINSLKIHVIYQLYTCCNEIYLDNQGIFIIKSIKIIQGTFILI